MQWSLPIEAASVAQAEAALDEFFDEAGILGHPAFVTKMVLEEITCNLVDHSPPTDGPDVMTIDVVADESRVTIAIEDQRAPFDPLDAPPLDVHAPLAERSTRGMGIHLVRQMTDELRYERHDGRNRLIASVVRS